MLCSAIAIPLLLINLKYARALGMLDWPKARGVAEDQIPIIGYSLVLFSLVVMVIFDRVLDLNLYFVLTSLAIALMGFLDDRRPLSPSDKLFCQAICVLIVVFLDPHLYGVVTEQYGAVGAILAVIFVLGLMNAINFIDGIDGLAGMVILIGCVGMAFFGAGKSANEAYFLLGGAILGMMLPFLYFNILKGKGFLGNVGSYFFGFTLAVMYLSVPIKAANALSHFSITGLCFLVPIADGCVVVASRLLSVRSPFQGDKGHLHHRLIQTSIDLKFVLLNFALIGFGGLFVAYLLSQSANSHGMLPFVVCLSHIVITAVLILMIEKASKRRLQSYFLRMDDGEPVYFIKYRLETPDGQVITAPTLRRLEAKVSAEIRISDICFTENGKELHVVLRTLSVPLQQIISRLDPIFQAEKLKASPILDKGEYKKSSYSDKPTTQKTPSGKPRRKLRKVS